MYKKVYTFDTEFVSAEHPGEGAVKARQGELI